ncbi:MAG: hypothetical protein EXR52_06080 [Dehalococcoidia bacterium]|nr:hypothetical protein [Dehalococcoidia bacterium]
MTAQDPSAPGSQLLNRLGLLFIAAVTFAVAAKPSEQLFQIAATTQDRLGTALPFALAATLFSGIGVALLVLAAVPSLGKRTLRLALVLGFVVAVLPPLYNVAIATKYGVDSASHTRYAAGLLLQGKHPYADFEVDASYARYPVVSNSITYAQDGTVMGSYTYPAGAFLVDVPFEALGVDIRWLYGLAGVALLGLVVWLAPSAVAMLALGYAVLHSFLSLWIAGAGVGEPLWSLVVVAAWLIRRKQLTSALLMGAALTIKQLSWFFFPFYVIAQYHLGGWKAALRCSVVAGSVFLVTNLPFALTDVQGWLQGVLGPMLFPLPVMGFGPARLGALVLPDLSKGAYTVLEVVALVAALVVFYKRGRMLPELAMVLPWLPLWLAWRSLSSYFYMLPLMVLITLFARIRFQRQEAGEARNPITVTGLTETVALMCIAAVVMSIGFWYESGLLWDELVANKAGLGGRIGLASLGVLLSACSISIILAVAAGAIRPWVCVLAVFSAFIGLGLVTAAAMHSLPNYEVDTAAAAHQGAQLLLEVVAGVACLLAYLRWGSAHAELALILPLVPLWFAWRSIYSYYYLIPLLVGAGLLLRERRAHPEAAAEDALPAPSPRLASPSSA